MRIVPRREVVEIGHRAFHADYHDDAFAGVSQAGQATVVSFFHQATWSYETVPCEAVAVSQRGDLVAEAGEGGLGVRDARSARRLWGQEGRFHGCLFGSTDRWIWSTRPLADNRICLEVRATESGTVLAVAEVDDPFRQSQAILWRHVDEARVVVWIAAGQEGAANVEATLRDGAIQLTDLPPRGSPPPEFSCDGRWYACAERTMSVVERTTMSQLLPILWPDNVPGDGGGLQATHLGGAIWAWHSNHGRIVLFDGLDGTRIEEIAIEGHGPMPWEYVEHQPNPIKGGRPVPTTIRSVRADVGQVWRGRTTIAFTAGHGTRLVRTRASDWLPVIRAPSPSPT